MILSSLSPVINTFACNWSEKLSGEAPGVSDSDALMMGVMVMGGAWWHDGLNGGMALLSAIYQSVNASTLIALIDLLTCMPTMSPLLLSAQSKNKK